ncbi:hypothetical protein [uncultured Tenacibaculum sp.]|uniref:hypothetical protein n=1 Tax=uncultured Tenacibaculum sp. TaxID=174713 RepID=UPI00261F6666|nr:hypothetical protein [uncultured Tenacibaculum sp.]
MKKSILNLGKPLNKENQQQITGGYNLGRCIDTCYERYTGEYAIECEMTCYIAHGSTF